MTHWRLLKVRKISILRKFKFLTQSVEDVKYEHKITKETEKSNYFERKINFFKDYFFGIHKDNNIILLCNLHFERYSLINHKLGLIFIIQLEENLKKSKMDRTQKELDDIKSTLNDILKIF